MATPGAAPKRIGTKTGRAWTLDNADATDRVKPRRPYTPYNLFYLLERERVVQGQGDVPSAVREHAFERESMATERSEKRPEDDIPMPSRYKDVIFQPKWYEPNLKEKRKHRKTHGKISFKDLTEIISKNWATIDAETKEYCTQVSEIGRKRYKEAITRYNASQKIITLKKERAAVESAKEQKKGKCPKVECDSPPRPRKGKDNPTTPDRIISLHAPIVTPPHSGHNNAYSPHVPSTPAASFYHYGPPPPMPPPMPHSQSQPHPHSQHGHVHWVPMYHHHQQQHHMQQQQPQQQHHHQPPPYAYHHLPTMHKISNNKCSQPVMSMKHDESQQCGGGRVFERPAGGGREVVHRNVDHSIANEGMIPECRSSCHPPPPSEESTMTHDEAMRICTLMGSPGKRSYQEIPGSDLLQNVMSFDFADHHSLSTEDGDMNRGLGSDSLLDEVEAHEEQFIHDQATKHDDNMLDLSELLPLELGEADAFPDLLLGVLS